MYILPLAIFVCSLVVVLLIILSLAIHTSTTIVVISSCFVFALCLLNWLQFVFTQNHKAGESDKVKLKQELVTSKTWKCVVSLCTHESRLPKLKPVIEGITIKQTLFDPDLVRLVVNLPRTFKGEPQTYDLDNLPEFLQKPYIKTVLVDDIGPASKVVYTGLEANKDPKTCIISIDDDNLYPPEFLETMVTRWVALDAETRQKTILCGYSGYIAKASEKIVKMVTIEDGHKSSILEGFGGVLYPSSFFSTQLIHWIKSLPKYCRLGDDFILSVWAATNGYNIHRVNPSGNWIFPWVYWSLAYGLDGSTPTLHRTKSQDCKDDELCANNIINSNELNYKLCSNHLEKTGTNAQKEWIKANINTSKFKAVETILYYGKAVSK